jgi:hypothetical protein
MRLNRVISLLATVSVPANALILPSNSNSPSRATVRTMEFSDVPRDSSSTKTNDKNKKAVWDWKSALPPPPEDQFIMTGDISVLFLYAFTSHYLNNFVVESIISNSETIQDAVNALDPMGDVITLQNPVWVQPDMIDTVLTLNAQDSLMDHWGPLFSTAGSGSVALCSCWLLAGWFHQAFAFKNSLDCDTTQALTKTFETWISAALLMCLLTLGSNAVVSHVPDLQVWLGCASCHDYLLTKADTMFLVDSSTVLFAWRWMANSIMNYFR